MSVVDLAKERLERSPHYSGRARCLACKHEWVAVAPIGTDWLECPACSLERGRAIFPFLRAAPHWTCLCGCDLFHIMPAGIYCPNCGRWQQGYDGPHLTGA